MGLELINCNELKFHLDQKLMFFCLNKLNKTINLNLNSIIFKLDLLFSILFIFMLVALLILENEYFILSTKNDL